MICHITQKVWAPKWGVFKGAIHERYGRLQSWERYKNGIKINKRQVILPHIFQTFFCNQTNNELNKLKKSQNPQGMAFHGQWCNCLTAKLATHPYTKYHVREPTKYERAIKLPRKPSYCLFLPLISEPCTLSVSIQDSIQRHPKY